MTNLTKKILIITLAAAAFIIGLLIGYEIAYLGDFQQGYQKGYDEGYRAGYDTGYDTGYKECLAKQCEQDDDCELSLCDCKCYRKRQTPEVLENKFCEINCLDLHNISGCECKDHKCERVTPLPELQVHFIDVGQGDSILIDLGLEEVLIDGGKKSPGVTDYISKYIDGPLEVMVATHPHLDHVGGLSKVLNDFQVKEIWLNRDVSNKDKDFYQKFMTAVEAEKSIGATVNYAKRNDIISTGNLNFSILNPLDTLFGEINNNSIVLRLEYGNTAFLFSGDAEKKAEASILTTGSELQAQILKASHHCSKTASTKAYLAEVKPEVAICMVGEGNQYKHPHQETLTALQEIGAKIYRTDDNGTIIVSTDGKNYQINTSK